MTPPVRYGDASCAMSDDYGPRMFGKPSGYQRLDLEVTAGRWWQ